MDYSLLLGIHDVGRAEREEDVEEVFNEDDQETENIYGTSPEGIAGYLTACRPLGPGEFHPYVDVYAMKSCTGMWSSRSVTHMQGTARTVLTDAAAAPLS